MSIKIVIREDKATLDKQIKALQYLLQHDTSAKDKQIHQQVLEELIRINH